LTHRQSLNVVASPEHRADLDQTTPDAYMYIVSHVMLLSCDSVRHSYDGVPSLGMRDCCVDLLMPTSVCPKP